VAWATFSGSRSAFSRANQTGRNAQRKWKWQNRVKTGKKLRKPICIRAKCTPVAFDYNNPAVTRAGVRFRRSSPASILFSKLSQRLWVQIPTLSKEVLEFSSYTALYNATGHPSMSVPLHWTSDGLPVGVMFSARFGEDTTLFRLAAQLEKAQPWDKRRPQL
jgi:amidase